MKLSKIVMLPAIIIILGFKAFSASAQNTCQGTITVTNSYNQIEFRNENEFSVNATNTGTNTITANVVDEIAHDVNCNGIDDRLECQTVGLGRCGDDVNLIASNKWENISLNANETKNLTWSYSRWIPGYCFAHTVYMYTIPLDSSNSCWKGKNNGLEESQNGNIQYKNNQAPFSSNSTLPLLDGSTIGFVTHLDLTNVQEGKSVQDLPHFKSDIDQWVIDSNKLRLVRLAVFPWDYVSFATKDAIEWKTQNLEMLDQTIDYAVSKGFRIILTFPPWDNSCAWQPPNTPNCSDGEYSQTEYNDYLTRFYSFTTQRWKNKIYIWNPFNESDLVAFTHYIGICKSMSIDFACRMQYPPPTYLDSDEYINAFNTALNTINKTIKAIDPQTKIMAHISAYPNKLWFYKTYNLFPKITQNIDAIGISLYPGTNTTEISNIGNVLDFLRFTYNKQVYLLETGIPEDQVTEPQRSSIINNYLTAANKHAQGVTFYQSRDDIQSVNGESTNFGVRKTDDSLKPSYSTIVNFINNYGWVWPKNNFIGWNYFYWPGFKENEFPSNCQNYSFLSNLWQGYKKNFTIFNVIPPSTSKIYLNCL